MAGRLKGLALLEEELRHLSNGSRRERLINEAVALSRRKPIEIEAGLAGRVQAAGAPGTMILLTGTGATALTANGRARYDLSQLISAVGTLPRRSFLRQIKITADITVNNAAGANVTVSWQKLYDFWKRTMLYMQGHTWVNVPADGGTCLRVINNHLTGKFPDGTTPTSTPPTWAQVSGTGGTGLGLQVANAGTAVMRLEHNIYFFDPRTVSPEDDLMPVGVFNGAYLELDQPNTAAGGWLGTGISVSALTLRVEAEIVQRDEVRFGSLWTIEARDQSALRDFISPDGYLYTDVSIYKIQTDGNVAAGNNGAVFFTGGATPDISLLTYRVNGLAYHDSQDPRDVISNFNDQVIVATSDFQPAYGLGNNDFVPIQWVPRSSAKRTHMVPDLSKSRLEITSPNSMATTSFRLALRYLKPTGPGTVTDLAAKANEALPPGFFQAPQKFLAAKTASKQPVSLGGKGAFLAKKIYRGGVPG